MKSIAARVLSLLAPTGVALSVSACVPNVQVRPSDKGFVSAQLKANDTILAVHGDAHEVSEILEANEINSTPAPTFDRPTGASQLETF